MRTCNCPNCSAPIKINETANFALCEHCGTVIDTADFRAVYVIEKRTVNKADEIRAKTEQKRSVLDNIGRILRWFVIVFWLIVTVLLWCISLFTAEGRPNPILMMVAMFITVIGFGLFNNSNF